MKKSKKLLFSLCMIASVVFSSCQVNESENNDAKFIVKDLSLVTSDGITAHTINDGLIYSMSYVENVNADLISFAKDNRSETENIISKENISKIFYTENYIVLCSSGEENTAVVTDTAGQTLFNITLEKEKNPINACENEKNICILFDNNTAVKYSSSGEHLADYSFDLKETDGFTYITGIAEKTDHIYCLASSFDSVKQLSKNVLLNYSEKESKFEYEKGINNLGDSPDNIFFDSSGNLVISGYDDNNVYIERYDQENFDKVIREEIEGVSHIYGSQAGSIVYGQNEEVCIFDIDTNNTETIYDLGDKTIVDAILTDNNVLMSLRENVYMVELTSQNIEGEKLSSELLNVPKKYADYIIRDMCVLEDGAIGFIAVDYNYNMNSAFICICIYDKTEGAQWYELPEFELEDESNISLINVNKDFAVFKNMDDVYSYSFKNDQMKQVSVNDTSEILSCCVSSDNKLTLLYNKNDTLFLSESGESTDNSEKKIHAGNGLSTDSVIRGNEEYKLFINAGDQLIGVKNDGKQDVLADWSKSGYKPEKIINLNLIDNNKFLCKGENDHFFVLEKSDGQEQNILNVGILGDNTSASIYSRYAKQFSGSEYIVNVKNYCEYEKDNDAGMGQFNLDIASGNIPDIVVFRGANDVDIYREKNLFEPLNQFIDSDTEINKDDYLSNVFDMNTVDGKLYYITPQVLVRSIMSKNDNTVNTLDGLTENISRYKNDSPFGEISNISILNYLLSINTTDYSENIDYIKHCLEFSKKYGFNDVKNELKLEDYYEGFHNNQIQFMMGSLGGFETYNGKNKAIFDGSMKLCGVSENEKDNIALEECFTMAITTTCTSKELAWKHIRNFLGDDYQNDILEGYGFPVKLSAIASAAKRAQDKEVTFSVYPIGSNNIDVGFISDEDVNNVTELLKNCNTKYSHNKKIITIIDNEALSYFSGATDIDTTISAIKNRVSLYINETK